MCLYQDVQIVLMVTCVYVCTFLYMYVIVFSLCMLVRVVYSYIHMYLSYRTQCSYIIFTRFISVYMSICVKFVYV